MWKTEGLKEPIVEETFGTEIGDRTKVTLPLAKKDQDDYHQDHHQGGKDGGEKGVDWQSRSESILSLIRDNPSISTAKLSESLNLSRRQVERALDLLKETGRIHREGSARNGKWIVD